MIAGEGKGFFFCRYAGESVVHGHASEDHADSFLPVHSQSHREDAGVV